MRRRAAEAGARLADRGCAWRHVAGLLGVAGRTLRYWRQARRAAGSARPLGRPARRSPRDAREAVIGLLDEVGPQVGTPTLRACFPAFSRAELEDLLSRYRRVWRARNRVPLRVLSWPVPGRVWAIDFSGPVPAIDGRDRYLLAVRDLATGRQLLWQPVAAATGEAARDALASLFARYGAPLVLKSDNGSAFTGGVVRELLDGSGVAALVSPPYWPRYNGAIEAGIGSLKGRTDAHAARSGHPGYWTADDPAAALAEANALARPFGPAGASPDEAWAARAPITEQEREAFQGCVEKWRTEESGASASCVRAGDAVSSERVVARSAIRLALEERGYLQYRRRRIPPPIHAGKAASIP